MSRNPTRCEAVLWAKLKDNQLGVPVHKQKILCGYIADFWCPRAGICIEVDGPCHSSRKAHDAVRDLVLRKKGIVTMRFTDKEVINNTNAVVALIKAKIAQRMK